MAYGLISSIEWSLLVFAFPLFYVVTAWAFLFAAMLKLIEIGKHVLWVNENGPAFRRIIDRLRSRTTLSTPSQSIYTALSNINSSWTPVLGIKEFRVWSKIEQYRLSHAEGSALKAWVLLIPLKLTDFAFVAPLGGALLIIVGLTISRLNWIFAPLNLTSLVIATVLLAFVLGSSILLIALEATVVYTRLGSYAIAYHEALRYVTRKVSAVFLRELMFLLKLSAAAIWIDAAVLSFMANAGLAQFEGEQLLNGIAGLPHCVYSAFMTIVLSSPLSPSNYWGEGVMVLITLHGIAIITVAFSSLLGQTKFPQNTE